MSKVKYFLIMLGIVLMVGGCGKEETEPPTEDLTTNGISTEDDLSTNLENVQNVQNEKVTIEKHESTSNVNSLLKVGTNETDSISISQDIIPNGSANDIVVIDNALNNFNINKIDQEIVSLYTRAYIDGSLYDQYRLLLKYNSGMTKLLYGEYIDDWESLFYSSLILDTLGNWIYTEPQPDTSQKISFENYIDLADLCGFNNISVNKTDLSYGLIKNTGLLEMKGSRYYNIDMTPVVDWEGSVCVISYSVDDNWFWLAVPNVHNSSAERFSIDTIELNRYTSGSRSLLIDVYSIYTKSEDGITLLKDIIGIDIPGYIIKGKNEVPLDEIGELLKDYRNFDWRAIWNNIDEDESNEDDWLEYDKIALTEELDEDKGQLSTSLFEEYVGKEYVDYLLEHNSYMQSGGDIYKNGELFISSNSDASAIDSSSQEEFSEYDNTHVAGSQVRDAVSKFQGNDIAIVVQTKEFANADRTNCTAQGANEVGYAFNYGALLTKDGKVSNGPDNMPEFYNTTIGSGHGKDTFITDNANQVYLVEYSEVNRIGSVVRKNDADNYYRGELHNTNGIIDCNYDIYGITEEGNSQYIVPSGRFAAQLIEDDSGVVIGIFFKQLN